MDKENAPGGGDEIFNNSLSYRNTESRMRYRNESYVETINHFGYSQEYMSAQACLITPRTYGTFAIMQFQPPISKCKITIDYEDADKLTIIDFDPHYPNAITHFIQRPKAELNA